MDSLRSTIEAFRREGRALGHFNISDSNQLKAIAEASKETGLPVVVGLSEGEREFFPLAEVRALIDAYIKEGTALYLNADHTYSLDKVREAVDAGVDSVVVDGAKLPREENIALVQAAVAYARQKGKTGGREVLIEGELGYIGSSSKVVDALPEGAAATLEMMTKPEELASFVVATGVDLMAPAVGNIHGIVKSGQPKLSISRIRALAEASSAPLVLHGVSGSADGEFTEAIKAGVALIHINTDLRLLYREGLEKELTNEPGETTPYKFLAPAVEEKKNYVAQKMRLFAGI